MIIKGFSLSAVAAGIKDQDRLDLGLIYSDAPAVTAGMFATSLGKTAFFGEDANWGRIIAAAGRAGVAIGPATTGHPLWPPEPMRLPSRARDRSVPGTARGTETAGR